MKATETNELSSEISFNVRVRAGDVCAPTFDKLVYEFEVIENQMIFLAPIGVEDCDHGVNGHILLSSSMPELFDFKLASVYRQGNLAIQMKQAFDYEKNKSVEFTISASGSPLSLNKFNTTSLVFDFFLNSHLSMI